LYAKILLRKNKDKNINMPTQKLPTTGVGSKLEKGDWGNILNRFLRQISPEINGGLNSYTSVPPSPTTGGTFTADDKGYTFINITDNTINKWNGSTWDVILKFVAPTAVKPILTGSLDESVPTAPVYRIKSKVNNIESDELVLKANPAGSTGAGIITKNELTGVLDETNPSAPVYKITSKVNDFASNVLTMPTTKNELTGLLDETNPSAPIYKITSKVNGVVSNVLSIPLEPVVVLVP
jgi:hypothetical protein